MTPESIMELLDREPFEPFVMKLTNGDVHAVHTPHAVAIMGTRLFLALSEERWVFIPLRHIVSVESLQAA